MGRWRLVRCALAWAAGVAGVAACGSARTALPTSVKPAPALDAVAVDSTAAAAADSEAEAETTQPPTTASAFKSPGEKHRLPGGTVAPSYPRVGVRPPKGVAPPPPGHQWAVVNVRFCANPEGPIAPELVDPGRFKVEVPGQGFLTPAPDAPPLSKTPLVPGNPGVAPGTCVEGSISYLVAGEGHIESITYDSGDGLLRWAT